MSVQEKEAMASLLFEHVKNNDIRKVEQDFAHFSEDSQWRDIVRCELHIGELRDTTLLYDMVLPRLLSYEISTLSPFHYAAFKGHNDILVNFIDHDIPVDLSVASGATALHLAAFGGKMDTVQLLIEVYKADINKQDRYGWSALHYAGTEGHKDVVHTLVVLGINVNLRDQDGTSAAFRAQVNGFDEIVDILCELEDDLLNVDPAYEGKAPPSPGENLYSTVKHGVDAMASTSEESPSIKREKSSEPPARRAQSEIVSTLSRKNRSLTLPKNFMENKTTTIRRIIRDEIKATMDDDSDPGYMQPGGLLGNGAVGESDKFALAGIGVNTLKGIMREELGKYTQEVLSRSQSVGSNSLASKFNPQPQPNTDYEDIYETVKYLDKQLPEMTSDDEGDVPDDEPPAPPLPPRNLEMMNCRPLSVIDDTRLVEETEAGLNLQKLRGPPAVDSVALKESIKRIGPILGSDWKKLAHALPLEVSPKKVEERVEAIEKRHPDDVNKQACMVLAEWRINKGSSVDVDDLVIGLRKCGLGSIISEVERVAQEFTA